jgi:hypothetical protein
MKTYWRLKKMDKFSSAVELINRIPELKKINSEYIIDNMRGSNMEFYYKEEIKTSLLIRLTLPFALIIMLILLIVMPINYIISGKWGYKWLWFANWLESLNIT